MRQRGGQAVTVQDWADAACEGWFSRRKGWLDQGCMWLRDSSLLRLVRDDTAIAYAY